MSMILKLSDKELARCKEFLDVKEMNLSSAEIYIEYLTYHCRDITKFDIEKFQVFCIDSVNQICDFFKGFIPIFLLHTTFM